MRRTGSIHTGVLLASIIAGPVFIVSAYAASLYLKIPAPVVLDGREILAFPLFVIPVTAFGFVVAVLPNLLGATLMAMLAERFESARLPFAWTFAGAAIGMALAFALEAYPAQPELAFGLTVAAAVSARLCRTSVGWRATD